MANNMENLQPHSVWAHFAEICAIPHASQQEAALRERIIGWARARGIEHHVDATGNLILRKPASAGCESRPGVILQAHLDMVCQVNAGTTHDFRHDPIKTVIRDGWVAAEQTTLGADNGIGVALALAALEEPELTHPPLEVLLTVNEESGMDGARGLAPGSLQGRALINLDTEEWGHFYLGCAGGVDVEVRHTCSREAPPEHTLWRLEVSGLRGGHSGIDIHLGRGNAIKLLAEALGGLAGQTGLHLIEMAGGTARNAIPREAHALFAAPVADAGLLEGWVKQCQAEWQQRFAEADANVMLNVHLLPPCRGKVGMGVETCAGNTSTPTLPLPLHGGGSEFTESAISGADQNRLFSFLNSAAIGVARMSDAFPGVVDTSDNLGVAKLKDGQFSATFKVRSLHDGRADALADELAVHAKAHGLQAWKDGTYPGWTPNPSSGLLALCQRAYTAQYGQPASMQVIHAGLECGLLAASHPHLDMISFGPDIRGAHAPGERVEIESVGRCWELLKAMLREMAAAY